MNKLVEEIEKLIERLEVESFKRIWPNPNDPIYVRSQVKKEIAKELRDILGEGENKEC